MDKCRICLSDKRKLQSIFDCNDGYTYACMMMSVANIKIVKNEDITEGICWKCSRKLKEAYDFKIRIERSDEILQNAAGFKRIHFTNLQDKIHDIEIDTSKKMPQQCYKDLADSLMDGKSPLVFKNITIQKIEVEDIKIEKENEPLSVVDFLNSFKPEENESCQDDNDLDHDQLDDDYTPEFDDNDDPDYNLYLTKSKKTQKNKKPKKTDENSDADKVRYKKIHIKPVILKDVQVLPTKRKAKEKTNENNENKKKKIMCNYCGKMVSSKEHLLTHTDVRPYKCDICSKVYLNRNGLINHMKSHNTQEKKFKCDKCIGAFISPAALQRHYVMHLDENKFVCDICSKAFKRKKALDRHKLLHNLANKNVKCDLCNMTFFSKTSLKHHLRIHTGERPFKCEICSQPYSYKHDFNRHCLKKHGVFLKRRSVYVMNEEVLQRERALMRDLFLKMQGVSSLGEEAEESLKVFEGYQGYLAYEMAIKALKSNAIPII